MCGKVNFALILVKYKVFKRNLEGGLLIHNFELFHKA